MIFSILKTLKDRIFNSGRVEFKIKKPEATTPGFLVV
jgi:hypothetical protein